LRNNSGWKPLKAYWNKYFRADAFRHWRRAGLFKLELLNQGYQNFKEIAKLWNQVSSCFEKVADTKSINYLKEASEILTSIAMLEKNSMEILAKIM